MIRKNCSTPENFDFWNICMTMYVIFFVFLSYNNSYPKLSQSTYISTAKNVCNLGEILEKIKAQKLSTLKNTFTVYFFVFQPWVQEFKNSSKLEYILTYHIMGERWLIWIQFYLHKYFTVQTSPEGGNLFNKNFWLLSTYLVFTFFDLFWFFDFSAASNYWSSAGAVFTGVRIKLVSCFS